MTYFFSKWNEFAGELRQRRNILLLFDFDGTLTPIVGEPKLAKLSPSVRRLIRKLAQNRRIDIGIISGRVLKDIMRLVGIKGIYYAGNHGLEIKGPGKLFIHPSHRKYNTYIKEIAAALRENTSAIKGAIVEHKRHSLSLHYRLVAPVRIPGLKSVFKEITAPYVKSGRIKITTGKKTFEVRPPVLWDKGEAVRMIENLTKRKNALKIFIGDDVTDEDAFRALRKNDFSIRIARKKTSKARYFLKDPTEVRRLLVKINKIVALFLITFVITMSLLASTVLAAERPDIVVKELLGIETRAEHYEEPFKIETKTYSARTKDGWEISIKRSLIKDEVYTQKPKAAVILCHGFNINNTFWDLDKRCSLARYLAKSGYDVWAPSLRGSGSSSRPVLSRIRSIAKFDLKSIPETFIKGPFDIAKLGWTIDDHIYKDIPAIIDLVEEESGFHKVYWIGHSMGGIIMYAYLETEGRDDIAGFIPIGSMIVIPDPLTPHLKKIASQKPLLTASLIVNTTVASQFRNFTFGTVKNPIEGLLFKRDNMHDDILVRFFRKCIDDTSAGVVTQFSDSIRKGSILSSDGRYNYSENMDRVRAPILIIGGSADGFVSEKQLADTYKRISSRDKGLVIFSQAAGYSTDYGHCDMLIGKNSQQEVYPVILKWLDERVR